ncbi:hypothetical protein EAI_12822, partial [Harpegnathos saltator]
RIGDLASLIDSLPQLPSFICLSETWLKDSDHFSIPNYNLVADNREELRGGSAITVLKNIKFSVINNHPLIFLSHNHNVNICIIEFTFNNKQIILISIYNPPNNPALNRNTSFWDRFFVFCDQYSNIIVLGDFN